jgi:hypothetical protein
MTCKRACETQVLSAVPLFITILAILVVLTSPPQLTAGGQPPAKSTVASTPSDASPALFLPTVTYGSGGLEASSVAVADVNGDGKPDLLVTNSCGEDCAQGRVDVLLGNGDGTFQPAVSYASGGSIPYSVAVADVNGDGKPDLVVANCGPIGINTCASGEGNSLVGVLLGNGDGTFQPVVTYDSGGQGSGSFGSVVVADVNGDGKGDVLVAICVGGCSPGGAVGVLLGNGDGTFQPSKINNVADYAEWVAAEDVNGDGKPDLLVAGNDTVSVLLGNGDGSFQPAVSYHEPGGIGSNAVAAADVNGDGKPDLLVANTCNNVSCTSGSVGVLLGNGDGTFQAAVSYDTGGTGARPIEIADVNGDGKSDLLVANSFYSTVGVLLGNDDGTFQAAMIYSSGGYLATSLAAADVNGDGSPDLLVANFCISKNNCTGEGLVGVLLNNTPFCTTAPVITFSTTPTSLWPPNGKMVPVTISGTVTDTGCTVKTAAYVVTDEYGEVQPSGPVTLGPGGAYSFTVLLQASRLGTDLDGRLYTITVSASNNGRKTGSRAGSVIVPHDQGH